MAKRIKITRKDKFLDQELIFRIFDEFINDSYSGRRTKKNGARLSDGTVEQYVYLKNDLLQFLAQSKLDFRIYIANNLTQGEREKASNYNRKFYRGFTNYLYNEKKVFDNYVGLKIKILRIFYNYLENERNISVGTYHRSFFVPKEEVPIVALNREQLNYFIYDKTFHQVACDNDLEKIKDVFVFGCTVALRVSDLMSLTRKNLQIQGNAYYIQVKSKKTSTYTSIKLPDYAVEILNKYRSGQKSSLLPTMTVSWFNKKLKELGALMPENFEMVKTRERKGKQIIIYKDPSKRAHYQLSDHLTTHTMRRTAITTMLGLGMPEHIVRKISGHSANSRDFYRYVKLSQSLIDKETDRVFDLLKQS